MNDFQEHEIDEKKFKEGFKNNEEIPDDIDILDEMNQNEDIPNFNEFNLEAEKIDTENLKEEIKKDSNPNNIYNLENISSFDSNDFCKMDLKNSFEIENKGYSSTIKSFIPNNFEDNLNLDNIENDFIIQNNFNNFIGNNKNVFHANNFNNNVKFNNDFDNMENLANDFNTNVHLHTDNINSIDNIDKSKINRKLAEKGKDKKQKITRNENSKETKTNSKDEKNSQKKKKKIDLNKTPLPIFACIYCSNENVVFTHMSNEIISDRYLYNCSPQDLKNINIIVSTYFVFNLVASVNAQVKSLVNIVLNNSEYLSELHPFEKSKQFIKNYAEKMQLEAESSDNHPYKPILKYRFFCTENTMMTFFFKNTKNSKFRNSNDIKSCPLISPHISNFNNNNNNCSSLNTIKIENPIKIKESFKLLNNKKLNKNANTNANINYKYLEEEGVEENENDGNIENLNYYDYENSNNLNNYSFLKFLKFDLKRKIKPSDISWESEEFDINDPKFSSDEEGEKIKEESEEELEVSDISCDMEGIEQGNNMDLGVNSKEEKNLISTFENLNLNNFNYLKSENDSYNRNNNAKDLYYNVNSNKKDSTTNMQINSKNNTHYNTNSNNEFSKEVNSPAFSSKKNVHKILVKKQTDKIKDQDEDKDNFNNKDKIKAKKPKQKKEKIDFSEILAEINRLKFSSDISQNNLNFNNNSKNDKMNINEELNFSNNCFPYRTMVYSSEILSSENISLMQNVSEINHDNNLSVNNHYNKKQELDNIDNSDRNINLNDYSFSRINSVNHSYNISSFMKKASNQTIETINRNSKNGFYKFKGKDTYTHRDTKDKSNNKKNALNKDSDNLLFSPGFHTKKNSQLSTNFRNLFEKNLSSNKYKNTNTLNFFNENNSGIYGCLSNLNRSTNKQPKLKNEKKIKFTKDYISPTIIDSKAISNQKFLKEFKDEKTPISTGSGKLQYNAASLESRKIMKIIPYNVNSNISNTKYDNNSNANNISNSINFIGGSNVNVVNQSSDNVISKSNKNNNNNNNNNFIVNNNSNSNYNVVYSNSNNVNFNNINSNHENSFVTKPTSGSAIIYKKNQELNFSTKITESNSSLREIIGAYSTNNKKFTPNLKKPIKVNSNFSSNDKTAFTSNLNFNSKRTLYNNVSNNLTKTKANYVNSSTNLNLNNVDKNNNNINANGCLVFKSNYISNIASSINNTNHNSVNFNSYLKSEHLNSLNKSNDLISPKNTFAPQYQLISTNKKLKDFVNLYSKKKFFRNQKFQVKSKEDNLGYANNLKSNNNNFNNNKGSNYFLSENLFNEDSSGNNVPVYSTKQTSTGVRFKSLRMTNEKLIDFE